MWPERKRFRKGAFARPEEGYLAFSIPAGSTGGSPANKNNVGAKLVPAGRMLPFFLVTALFFLWAIPNNLNDILIRQFMKSFEISRLQAGLVQSAFYMGYFQTTS